MPYKMYHGRAELDPGVLRYRERGWFLSYDRARAFQKKLATQGLKARVVRYENGFAVQVMSRHDTWGRNYEYSTEE